jgi:hypothetical protein
MRPSIAQFKNNGKLCALLPFILNIKLYKVAMNFTILQLKITEFSGWISQDGTQFLFTSKLMLQE